jgi:hypothetical protein
MVRQFHTPKAHLVAVVEGMRLSRRQLLLVDVRVIGAVQILDKNLSALQKDAGVPPRDTSLVSTVIGQVNLWKDTADRILSPHDEFGLACRKDQRRVGILHNQATLDTGR